MYGCGIYYDFVGEGACGEDFFGDGLEDGIVTQLDEFC
jgi:hypothetical protein